MPFPRFASLAFLKRETVVSMVVALPLFLQNVDTSIMATALPTMAAALHVGTLRLNLAITAYLISLAIFLPASGWLAERFGPRRVFCWAIGVFSLASALCGLADSLAMLVVCRVLQGMGGAMMLPVGRLILLRSVPPAAIIAAMTWFTVPPAFGRLIGPLMGGAILTLFSWHWIFLINVPIGIIAIGLAVWLVKPDAQERVQHRFDGLGFVLLGAGVAGVLAAAEAGASSLLPLPTVLGIGAVGAFCLAAYLWHERRAQQPLIDLSILRFPTFFASVIGGFPLRLALGSIPFLLPLLMQLGFGLSPLDSGLLTMATALGALATRTILGHSIRTLGFKPILVGGPVLAGLSYFAYAAFRPTTPHAVLFIGMLIGGLVMSMSMVSLQTLAFTEIPKPTMGHATAMSAMAQQLSLSLGVLMAVELLRLSVWLRGGAGTQPVAADFPLAFCVIGVSLLASVAFFTRLPRDVGAELREKRQTTAASAAAEAVED